MRIHNLGAEDDGRQWLAKITLDPQIEWTGETRPTDEQLAELHHEAHHTCYIANSIRSEVVISSQKSVVSS